MVDDRRDHMLEEERPLIEFPTLVKFLIAFGALIVGVTLLVLPWYIALALFAVAAGMIAIFFDPYYGLIAFLIGALLHPIEFLSGSLAISHVSTILAVAVLFIWIFHIIVYRDFKIVDAKQNLAVLLFGVLLFLSTLQSFNFSFPQFVDFAKLFILYFLVVNLVRTREKYVILMWGLVILGLIACFIGIYQHIKGIGSNHGDGLIRISGTALDPNDFAMHLVILVPMVFAIFFNYKNIAIRVLSLLLLALLVLNIIFTYSRGGMLGFAVVFIFSILTFSFQRKKVILPIILVAIGIASILPFIPAKYWERVQTITDFDDPAIQARLDTWKTGLGMMSDHPIRGVGLGAFRYEYIMRAYTSGDVKTKASLFSHNAYIQIGAEIGIPALALFLLLLFLCWMDLAKAEKVFLSRGDLLFAGFSLSIKLGLLGYIVCAIFLTQAFLTMIWILLPLAVVSRIVAKEGEKEYVSA